MYYIHNLMDALANTFQVFGMAVAVRWVWLELKT